MDNHNFHLVRCTYTTTMSAMQKVEEAVRKKYHDISNPFLMTVHYIVTEEPREDITSIIHDIFSTKKTLTFYCDYFGQSLYEI